MNYSAFYIVFDGTAFYGVYGCDIPDEITDNDMEVVAGPFAEYPEGRIEELAREAYPD